MPLVCLPTMGGRTDGNRTSDASHGRAVGKFNEVSTAPKNINKYNIN